MEHLLEQVEHGRGEEEHGREKKGHLELEFRGYQTEYQELETVERVTGERK